MCIPKEVLFFRPSISISHQCTSLLLLLCSYEIMEDCWKQDPEDRPTFSEVYQTLHTLIDAENSENYISIMAGMDLSPTEHVQMEDEWSDQLQMAEDEAALTETGVFTESSCVVVEVH